MRKTIFAIVFSVCAGAASASSITNASGVADTAVTGVNTTVNGHAVGVWGNAMDVDGMNGYRGTGVRADGMHYGLDVKAGPGDGYHVRGAFIDAVGSAQAGDVWGIESNVQGVDWAIGYDTYTGSSGGTGIGYRTNVSGFGDAIGFQTNAVYSYSGNAFGFQNYSGAYASIGSAFGASLGSMSGYGGDGFGVHIGSVYGDYSAYGYNVEAVNSGASNHAYGFRAPTVASAGSDAYGLYLPSVSGYYTGYGVWANGTGNYGGAYGVYASGNTQYYNGYGVYAYGYSENQDGIGIYAEGGTNSGNAYAGVFSGDILVSSSVCVPCSPSDQMFKKNVKPLAGGISTIMALKPKSYEMKADEFKDKIKLSKGKQRGFIAQELETVIPEMVHEVTWPAKLTEEERKNHVKKEGLKYKAVNYNELIPVLVQAMQEQQALIKALENKVAQLEAR